MKRILRLLLGAVAISLVGIVVAGIYSRVSEKPDDAPWPPESGTADLLVIPEFRHSQYEGDRVAWELRARKASFSDMTHATLEAPTMEIQTRERGPLLVTFPEGRIDLERKILNASGPAEMRTADGYTVRTGDLSYDGRSDCLTTTSGFEVEGTRLRARGERLMVFPGQRRYEASGNIRVIYYPGATGTGVAG